MSNIVLRATTDDGLIRAAAAITTDLVEDARKRHNTAPTATAVLGRALSSNIFLGMNLKGNDTITMRFLGNGPIGAVVTQANASFGVRGYVQEPSCHLPLNELGKLDVGSAVGKEGLLYVTKDLGLKEAYTGSSPLISGEIGDDVAHYLNQSEQTPAVVAVGVLVDTDNTCKAAGGFFIQVMPGADEKVLAVIEQNLKDISSVTDLIVKGLTPQEMLTKVFKTIKLNVLEQNEWEYKCSCNKERLEKVLISLGEQELNDMLEKEKGAELRCHFCNEYYRFTDKELEVLIDEINKK